MRKPSDCTVLLVDDTQINRDLLVETLRGEYRLAVAVDGESALEYVDRTPPDLILLDIMMPGLDGYQVCARLKSNPKTKDIPVLFLTALDDIASKTKGFDLGAVDYITKPFQIREVKARINTHLRLKLVDEENRRTNRLLQYLADHDDLTGLYNTRYLYRTLGELLEESGLAGNPVSLIFMDLDHFKSVVDTHGHLNGSQTIRQTAQLVASTLTPPCFGVAYGGDEFVVVLPGFSRARAVEKAGEMRKRLEETVFLADRGLTVRLTASFGVAAFPADAADMTELLGLADQALFRVKASGKNRVE